MELNVTRLTDRNDIMGTYDIYKHCMYMPTEEIFKTKADTYFSNDSVNIYACMHGTEIKGVIVISFLEQYKVEILGIAVAESGRNKGIGSYMINKLVDNYGLMSVLAETDKDAVDFYRKNGFGITEFFQNYGEETVVRYKCELVKKS